MTGPALVLGGGYLGTRLARRLSGEGAAVTLTYRSHPPQAPGAHTAAWDASLPGAGEAVAALARGAARIFFTAAPARGGEYAPVYLGAARALAGAGLAPEQTVVWISSTSVYGTADGSWVDESTPPAPASPGGAVLLEAERILLAAPGPALRIVRAAAIYGPGRTPVERLSAGGPLPGTGEEWLNLIHVEDLVTIAIAAGERGQDRDLVVAADGRPVRRRVYYAEASVLAAMPPPVFAGGAAGPHVAGTGKRARSRRLEELGVALRHPDFRAGLRAAREERGPEAREER